MIIRQAVPEDNEQAVLLLFEAIGDISYVLTGATEEADALSAMRSLFRQPGNRLSFHNCTIIEIEGQIAGAMLAYHGSNAAELDRPLIERLAAMTAQNTPQNKVALPQESLPDEYYLDSIAVHHAFRGRGLAKELMKAFEEEAARRGYAKLSLICEQHNDNAKRLYLAQGYQSDGYRLFIAGHEYDHMVKLLPASAARVDVG